MNDYVMNPYNHLVYRSFVRYDTLSRLINDNYSGSDSEVIDIFIDISPFIMRTLNSGARIESKDQLYITAWAINLCAHYRNFFKTRYNTYARIYLIYTDILDNGSTYRTMCQEYTKEIIYPQWANTVNMNIYNLSIICGYIPNVKFIRTKYEFSTKTKYIINRKNKEEYINGNKLVPNMIISTDIINSQLCTSDNNCSTRNWITMLVPSKYKSEDQSYMVNANNAVINYISNYKKCNVTPLFSNPSYIAMMAALSGYKNRGFKSILSIRQAVNLLNRLYTDNIISNDLNSLYRIYKSLGDIYPNKVQFSDTILNRFMALYPDQQILSFYVDELDMTSYTNMTELYDRKSLYNIIGGMLTNYEIDIMSL